MPVRSFLARTMLLTVVAAIASGCHRSTESIEKNAPIILISIDTLRSDHLPAYGYRHVATPALDALRADSVLYEHAYAHAPLTLVSHASMFTGLLPADHGIRDNLGFNLNKNVRTITEVVKSKGYATGGAVSAVVLRSETGISRGFDFWNDDIEIDPRSLSIGRAQRSGDETREIAQKWIAGKEKQPFFFFFHIYEPHTPYDPPEPFRSQYGATYDGDIAAADAVVGRFLAFLRQEGIYDRATIILVSDHGEGLGDHGEDEHGVLLYREDLQVPMMLKLPGQREHGRSVAAPVQLIDLFPTISEAVGEPSKTAGTSLLAAMGDKLPPGRAIYSETYYPRFHFGWSDLHSLISGSDHFIQAPKPELYDLAGDPAEKRNTLEERRRVYSALRQQIGPFIKSAEAPKVVDEEQSRQLTALGYIGSTVPSAPNEALPDPKDHIAETTQIKEGFAAFQQERFQDAVTIFHDLLQKNPRMLDVLAMQSRALARLGRDEEAIEVAKQGLRVSPTATNLMLLIANTALETGRLDEAEKHARLALKDVPNEAHRLLAQVYLARKDFEHARQEANAAAGEKRDRPFALMLLGRIDLEQGRLDQALREFDEAAAIQAKRQQPVPKLSFYRGDCLARLGRAEEAETAFREEIKQFPSDPQAYKNLILLEVMQGKSDVATQLIFALEKASPVPPTYVAISETLKTIGDRNGSRFWAARGLSRFPADRHLQALVHG